MLNEVIICKQLTTKPSCRDSTSNINLRYFFHSMTCSVCIVLNRGKSQSGSQQMALGDRCGQANSKRSPWSQKDWF